jgi:iron complex outermembrane receptor protein
VSNPVQGSVAYRRLWLSGASALGLLLTTAPAAALAQSEPADGAIAIDEIVVTATRSAVQLSKVPISVAAVSNEQIQNRGLKEFGDVVRLTPGIALGANNRLAIRGVSSSAGAATTGVYLDDVPIQVRQVGYTAANVFPTLFDLERVEVLRGPQGTLFGAGSQGGTVRFIQPGPNFSGYEGLARAEVTKVRGGGSGYEAGMAIGGPIIEDKVAFRASAYHRLTPGYIDRVVGQAFIEDPTMPPVRDDAMRFNVTGAPYKNSNWAEASSARGALAIRATDNLTITVSLNAQKNYEHDRNNSVWTSLTDAGAGEFRTPLWQSGPTGSIVNGVQLTPMEAPELNRAKDTLYVPYVNVEWANDDIRIISTTSALERDSDRWLSDSSYLYNYTRIPVMPNGFRSASLYEDWQNNITQEIRVQSVDPDRRLTWLVGAFYTRNRQGSIESIFSNFMRNAPTQFGDAPNSPFPGAGTFLNTYGIEPGPNSLIYYSMSRTREVQLAGFGQVDFKITPELTFTVGARYAQNKLQGEIYQDGPENNLNAPYGSDCTTPGGCTPGVGEWAPVFVREGMKNKEKVFNPKFSLSWQRDPDNLFYATVAKGFRPGGVQERLPGVCFGELENFGYVDGSGNVVSPTSYDSDSVWSYEAGSKNRVLDGRLSVDGSVYNIKWKNIQTRVTLPDCGYALTDNMGTATSRGFDLALSGRATDNLTLSAAIGYNSTKFDETNPAFQKGDYVPGAGAPWVLRLSYDYTREVSDSTEFYSRGDVVYNSKPRLTGSVNPNSPSYQPLDLPEPETTVVNARLGVIMNDVDLSLFANNLLNHHERLGRTYTRRSVLFTETYMRPRTIGIAAMVRY